jgi:hypothetical protein
MLDLEYNVFPCRLQSSEGQAITHNNQRCGCGFDFDIVQLIQNENVDAGLIYGNAMVARAAAFRHDDHDDEEADADANAAAQQEEMQLLAGQVWKLLRQQDCAMLL